MEQSYENLFLYEHLKDFVQVWQNLENILMVKAGSAVDYVMNDLYTS